METLLHDIRFALRGLVRNPGFTMVAVASLALGIGVNSAMFSGVYQVLMRPLPFSDPAQLVEVRLDPEGAASKATLTRLWTRLDRIDDMAGWAGSAITLTGAGQPERLSGARVTANLFTVLGMEAEHGRALMFEDGEPGAERVVILSHGLWSRLYGSDPDAVGSSVTLDGVPHIIVGVMPEGFDFPSSGTAVWLPDPLDTSDAAEFDAPYLQLVARLANSATAAQALVELERVSVELRSVFVGYSPTFGNQATVRPLGEALVGETKTALIVLFGAVGFVLLIVCANVANLLLGRAAVRQEEIAVRTALGAPRGRVVRQLLTESVCLASLGGGLGLLLAIWGTETLGSALPADLPGVQEIGVGREVLVFTLFVSVLAGIVFGLAPALQSSRPIVRETMGSKGRGAGSERGAAKGVLGIILIAEVALALILVTGAGLMIQNFWNLSRIDPGFDATGVLTMRLSPAAARYASPLERREYWDRLLRDVRLTRGVALAAAVEVLPFEEARRVVRGLEIDQLSPLASAASSLEWHVVSPDYFAALEIPVGTGRVFTERDRSSTERVAVVSRSFARRYFQDEDPLGRHIRSTSDRSGVWSTIVGVVGDTHDQPADDTPPDRVYRPLTQNPVTSMALTVRTMGDPRLLTARLREVIRAVDPDVPISSVRTLEELLEDSVSQPRMLAQLLAIFGALAVLLGAIGIYGVTSFAVSHRSTEISVRIAVGAEAGTVFWQIMRESLELVGIGLLLGVGGAIALTRILASRLYQLDPTSPLALGAVAVVLSVVGVLAAYFPSRRASRTDPADVVRGD
ncbi:MAG: ABC transporter permease [Gemmatimonadota bacterium]|nr:MAG: ABC transporter permease [Gemmatimonadota bacterium]